MKAGAQPDGKSDRRPEGKLAGWPEGGPDGRPGMRRGGGPDEPDRSADACDNAANGEVGPLTADASGLPDIGASLVKGAAILGVAAVVSKLLGTLQKIPLQNIAGDEAYGIYNAVYPFYILIMFLASAGFPLTVAKFVAERAAAGRPDEARRVLAVASAVLMATGLLSFLLLFFGAGYIAGWIGNMHTQKAIESVSFALLVVPVMAAMRGYFQGLRDMSPTAVSQVVEQFIRVLTMIVLLLYFAGLELGSDWVAAGATFGSVTGAIAGLAVMLAYWAKERRKIARRRKIAVPAQSCTDDRRNGEEEIASAVPVGSGPGPQVTRRKRESALALAKQIVLYALPICLGSIVMPIVQIVDTFTMPRLLKLDGLSDAAAMSALGVYSRAQPLVQSVAMIASSLSVALVPAIAEARQRGAMLATQVRTEMSLRLTWYIGLASSVGLAILALPLNVMLYKDDAGTAVFAITAFTAVFSSLNIISGSVLQGLGLPGLPARNLLIAAILKTVLNIVLMPQWGLAGAAWAGVVAFGAAALLNMVALQRASGIAFLRAGYIVRPAPALGLMAAAAIALALGVGYIADSVPWHLSARLASTLGGLAAVTGGALVFGFAIFRTGAVTREDLQAVPSLGSKLLPLLTRFGMLKPSR